MKPENAINIPEKYKIQINKMKNEAERKPSRKPARIRQTTPLPSVDFSDPIDLTLVFNFLKIKILILFIFDQGSSVDTRKVRKVIKGKKKYVDDAPADVRDYGLSEPVRKVFNKNNKKSEKQRGRKRIKFGTRTIPKTVYDPLTL